MSDVLSASDIRHKIFAAKHRRYADVDVHGFGTIRVQSLSEKERSSLEVAAGQDPASLRSRMIAAAIVDQDGNRVFSDAEVDQIGEVDFRVTLALADAVAEHCGGIREDAAADVDAVKN